MLFLVIAAGGVLRLYGLGSQPPVSDDVQAAFSAVHYMEDGQFGPTMWYHPNLRNILVYWATEAFGYGPIALRSVSVAAGVLAIPLVYLMVRLLTEDERASLLAAFLIAMEEVHITLSRQAVQETTTMFLTLAGVVLAIVYRKKGNPWALFFSGLAFGLGAASKLHAVPPLMVCLGFGLYYSYKERSLSKGSFAVSCLFVLPLTVYLVTYIPWFGRGYGLGEWLNMQGVLFEKMMTHKGNPADILVDIRAWQWFVRPMGYANFGFHEGSPVVSVAYSNPVVWFLVLPSAAYCLARAFKRPSHPTEGQPSGLRVGMFFLMSLFAVSYLPLAAASRPVWLLSSLAVIPFAFSMVAIAISDVAGRWRFKDLAVSVYLLLVVATSLAIYPMATGRAMSREYLSFIVEKFRPGFETGAPNP